MSLSSADELGQLVVRLQLVEPEQLDECMARLNATSRTASDLLELLESQHVLTPYQVSRLEKGETEGLVLGRYKLLYRNASGSFARVFRACSVDDGRMVALKVLRQRWAQDAEKVAMFRREAELGRKLKHENIVPIYEVASQGDYHYFTMEFVVGGNLRDILNIRKKLSPIEACRCVLDMSRALDYALSQGVTHRDLKLTNVLMSTHGVAMLVDFGLAGDEEIDMLLGGESPRRALEYAALENATNAPKNDPRTDLYFLGAIFFELLTGTPPYERTRDRNERRNINRYRNVPPIHTVDPNIPRVVADIVERMMKIRPEHRYQTAQVLIGDLQAALLELGDTGEKLPALEERSTATDSDAKSGGTTTVMCIESRIKQQNLLRDYLSDRGFRVLMLNDVQRGLARLKSNPPDCVIFMGEPLGNDIVTAYRDALQLQKSMFFAVIVVLADAQKGLLQQFEQSPMATVLVQPITLRDLRREIYLILQRRRRVRESRADAS